MRKLELLEALAHIPDDEEIEIHDEGYNERFQISSVGYDNANNVHLIYVEEKDK